MYIQYVVYISYIPYKLHIPQRKNLQEFYDFKKDKIWCIQKQKEEKGKEKFLNFLLLSGAHQNEFSFEALKYINQRPEQRKRAMDSQFYLNYIYYIPLYLLNYFPINFVYSYNIIFNFMSPTSQYYTQSQPSYSVSPHFLTPFLSKLLQLLKQLSLTPTLTQKIQDTLSTTIHTFLTLNQSAPRSLTQHTTLHTFITQYLHFLSLVLSKIQRCSADKKLQFLLTTVFKQILSACKQTNDVYTNLTHHQLSIKLNLLIRSISALMPQRDAFLMLKCIYHRQIKKDDCAIKRVTQVLDSVLSTSYGIPKRRIFNRWRTTVSAIKMEQDVDIKRTVHQCVIYLITQLLAPSGQQNGWSSTFSRVIYHFAKGISAQSQYRHANDISETYLLDCIRNGEILHSNGSLYIPILDGIITLPSQLSMSVLRVLLQGIQLLTPFLTDISNAYKRIEYYEEEVSKNSHYKYLYELSRENPVSTNGLYCVLQKFGVQNLCVYHRGNERPCVVFGHEDSLSEELVQEMLGSSAREIVRDGVRSTLVQVQNALIHYYGGQDHRTIQQCIIPLIINNEGSAKCAECSVRCKLIDKDTYNVQQCIQEEQVREYCISAEDTADILASGEVEKQVYRIIRRDIGIKCYARIMYVLNQDTYWYVQNELIKTIGRECRMQQSLLPLFQGAMVHKYQCQNTYTFYTFHRDIVVGYKVVGTLFLGHYSYTTSPQQLQQVLQCMSKLLSYTLRPFTYIPADESEAMQVLTLHCIPASLESRLCDREVLSTHRRVMTNERVRLRAVAQNRTKERCNVVEREMVYAPMLGAVLREQLSGFVKSTQQWVLEEGAGDIVRLYEQRSRRQLQGNGTLYLIKYDDKYKLFRSQVGRDISLFIQNYVETGESLQEVVEKRRCIMSMVGINQRRIRGVIGKIEKNKMGKIRIWNGVREMVKIIGRVNRKEEMEGYEWGWRKMGDRIRNRQIIKLEKYKIIGEWLGRKQKKIIFKGVFEKMKNNWKVQKVFMLEKLKEMKRGGFNGIKRYSVKKERERTNKKYTAAYLILQQIKRLKIKNELEIFTRIKKINRCIQQNIKLIFEEISSNNFQTIDQLVKYANERINTVLQSNEYFLLNKFKMNYRYADQDQKQNQNDSKLLLNKSVTILKQQKKSTKITFLQCYPYVVEYLFNRKYQGIFSQERLIIQLINTRFNQSLHTCVRQMQKRFRKFQKTILTIFCKQYMISSEPQCLIVFQRQKCLQKQTDLFFAFNKLKSILQKERIEWLAKSKQTIVRQEQQLTKIQQNYKKIQRQLQSNEQSSFPNKSSVGLMQQKIDLLQQKHSQLSLQYELKRKKIAANKMLSFFENKNNQMLNKIRQNILQQHQNLDSKEIDVKLQIAKLRSQRQSNRQIIQKYTVSKPQMKIATFLTLRA